MEAYQERMIQEKKGLDDKIEKLQAFMNSALFPLVSAKEQELLRAQRGAMRWYSKILEDRIAIFRETE